MYTGQNYDAATGEADLNTPRESGTKAPPAAGTKSQTSLMLLTLLGFTGFVLLFLGCWLWRHHDISGQCMLANSGTTYLNEAADFDCCNPPFTPSPLILWL